MYDVYAHINTVYHDHVNSKHIIYDRKEKTDEA
jgi:hypothetical protein